MNKCPNCKNELLVDHSFCPNCGTDLRPCESKKQENANPNLIFKSNDVGSLTIIFDYLKKLNSWIILIIAALFTVISIFVASINAPSPIQWLLMLILLAPLPFAIYQRIKHGGVSNLFIVLSTISFALLTIIILILAYAVIKFGIHYIAGITILLTIIYFILIRKQGNTYKPVERDQDSPGYYFRNNIITIATIGSIIAIILIYNQEIRDFISNITP